MIAVYCNLCSEELQEPGGLMFSPPSTGLSLVQKLHICVSCLTKIMKKVYL